MKFWQWIVSLVYQPFRFLGYFDGQERNELRLSVTMTTLTIFNEYTRYNAWRMAKNFSFFFRYVYAAAGSSRGF